MVKSKQRAGQQRTWCRGKGKREEEGLGWMEMGHKRTDSGGAASRIRGTLPGPPALFLS